MPFTFRDKGRLSDRLRDKSFDEISKELRDYLHLDRDMSFESTPTWGGFSSSPAFARAGFPFSDRDTMSRPDMRAHFDDLASRHPEFAEHLRPTQWMAGETDPHFFHSTASGPNLYRQRHPSGGSSTGSGTYCEDDAIPIPVIHEDSGGGGAASSRSRTRKIPQYGLRNTVDLGESHKSTTADGGEVDSRNQRSWSAPPDNRSQGETTQPKRFVSRVEVNNSPSNPSASGESEVPSASNVTSPGKPPPFPKSSGVGSSHPSTNKQSNVRHIPIFVEGRDEPILPKPTEAQSFASSHSSSGFGQPHSYAYTSAPPGSHSAAFASSHSPCGSSWSHSTAPQAQASAPQAQASAPHAQASAPHAQANAPQAQASAPQDPKQEAPSAQPHPPPPKPTLPKDPIAKVQAIQEEVNELKNRVEGFTGSKTDKDYIFLDEMLTRNLLKLDDIETEGKDEIRQVRKEAIRSIQRCISVLESKALVSQKSETERKTEQSESSDVVMDEESGADACVKEIAANSGNVNEVPSESMEVQQSSGTQEHKKSETVAVVSNTSEMSQSANPMEVTTGGEGEDTNKGVMSCTSEAEIKPGNSEVMEVVTENENNHGSQEVVSTNLGNTVTEVQAVVKNSGTIPVNNTGTNGANVTCEPCGNRTGSTDAATEEKPITKDTGEAANEGENAKSDVAAMSLGEVSEGDANEPLSMDVAQNGSMETSKDSEMAAEVTHTIDETQTNNIPPSESAKKESAS